MQANVQVNSVSNEALVEAGLVSLVPATPTLMAAESVRRGKGYVQVQRFSNTGSASTVKAALKLADPTLSAKALSRKVNETLRGERDVRCQLAVAWVQSRYAAGDVPSHGEVSSGGSVLRMKSAPEAVAVIVQKAPEPTSAEDIGAAIAALQAKLAALTAPKQ
jgi:hypothetical protein